VIEPSVEPSIEEASYPRPRMVKRLDFKTGTEKFSKEEDRLYNS
jgi:hypothetical protein